VTARHHARPVEPDRLGGVGRNAFAEYKYAIERGRALFGSSEPKAEIPFVVEAWAKKKLAKGDISLDVTVNQTPIVGTVGAYRDEDKDIRVYGPGWSLYVSDVPTKGAYAIRVNIGHLEK
jgi:hypothetical protein